VLQSLLEAAIGIEPINKGFAEIFLHHVSGGVGAAHDEPERPLTMNRNHCSQSPEYAGMEDSQHFYESVDLGLDDVPAEGFRFQLSRPPAGVQAVYNRRRVRDGALSS
jgi:hypothetical protein